MAEQFSAYIDGGGSSEIGAAFNTEELKELSLTNGRLYFRAAPVAGGESLYAMTLPSATPSVVDSVSASGYFSRLFAIGDFLYYSSVNSSVDTISANVRKDDNSTMTPIANAMWAGEIFTGIQLGTVFEPSDVILAETVTTPVAGVKCTTYDATTAAAGNALGTLDGAFVGKDAGSSHWLGTLVYGFGNTIMGWGFFDAPPSYTTDVFVANSGSVDSLQNVTNTPAANERPLF